jgi:hypothetical protein
MEAKLSTRNVKPSFQIRCGLQSSQVKLLTTNNEFCIEQRATAQTVTGMFRGDGEAQAPPGFQAGWSDCFCFFIFWLI